MSEKLVVAPINDPPHGSDHCVQRQAKLLVSQETPGGHHEGGEPEGLISHLAGGLVSPGFVLVVLSVEDIVEIPAMWRSISSLIQCTFCSLTHLMMSLLEAGTAALTASSVRPSPYAASRAIEYLNYYHYYLWCI